MRKPDGRIKIPEEQFQFRTPGGTGVLKFADKSAFGHKATPDAGLAVYADTVDDLAIPGSSSSPLGVKHYQESRELEFGAATGTEISAVRPVTGVGLEGKTLYLAEELVAPNYAQRVKANLTAAGDVVRGRQKGIRAEAATAEDIAQSRFGKETGTLTPDEAEYVQKAQQSDEVLQTAAAQGDETAQGILNSRQPFDDAVKRTEMDRLEGGMAGRTPGSRGRVPGRTGTPDGRAPAPDEFAQLDERIAGAGEQDGREPPRDDPDQDGTRDGLPDGREVGDRLPGDTTDDVVERRTDPDDVTRDGVLSPPPEREEPPPPPPEREPPPPEREEPPPPPPEREPPPPPPPDEDPPPPPPPDEDPPPAATA